MILELHHFYLRRIIMNNFKVFLEDGNGIILSENNLVNSGGEGKIYIKDSFAYKIYNDINKSISKEKLEELKIFDKSNIIRPLQILKDKSHNVIGYQMKALDRNKCYPLTRFFTEDFRRQHNINNDDVVNIIKKIYETFEFIHEKNGLIVDGNEMNYLISSDFKDIYFIDVDSYKTKNFLASAYNPLTLDPLVKNNQFTKNSDWYIFGVLFCQIVLGIHPFKGKYVGNSININNRDIEAKMINGISIFRKNIRLNSAVRDFSLIPKNMLTWLENIFSNKIREKPPLFNIIEDVKILINKNINSEIKSILVESFSSIINDVYFFKKFIIKSNGYYYYGSEKLFSTDYSIFFVNDKIVFLILENDDLYLYTRKEKFLLSSNIKNFYIINNYLYIVKSDKLINADILLINDKYMIMNKNSWPIYEYMNYNNVFLMYQNDGIILYTIKEEKNSILNFKNILKSNEKIIDVKSYNDYLIAIIYNGVDYVLKIYHINEYTKNILKIYEIITDSIIVDFVFNGDVLIGKKNNDEILVGYYKEKDKDFKYKKIDNVSLPSKIYYLNDKVLYINDKDLIQIKM